MRFEFYHAGLEETPKLSVDGIVPNSAHFSHWAGNETPAEVKADTSTEIALNLVVSPRRRELTRGIELVTNNHFDTDGVLSVWTMLEGERALELRDELIAAAEAGDFSDYTGERAVRASIAIQGSEQPITEDDAGSPLARHLAGEAVADDALAYALVLPEVERVLRRTEDYEALWRDEWERIARSMESFARGSSRVDEDTEARLSVVTLAADLFGGRGFKPTSHAVPFTAISHNARGEAYLISAPLGEGWAYRVDYPYYSWAETVKRPPVARHDFTALVARLNEAERGAPKKSDGRWKLDASELSSAIKFADATGARAASALPPERVAEELRAELLAGREREKATAGAPL